MKHLWNVLIVFGVVYALILLLVAWVNFFYLPTKAKSLVVHALEENTGLQAELERLSLNPFKGFVLKQLTLRHPDEESPLFRTEAIYLKPLWLPLLLQRQFVASHIIFKRPSFYLIREPDNRWNILKLVEQKEAPPLSLIPKLSILQGDVTFIDQTLAVPFLEKWVNVHARITLQPFAQVRYQGSAQLEGRETTLTFRGTHALTQDRWSLRVTAQHLASSDLSPYLESSLPFLKEAEGDLSAELSSKNNRLHIEKIHFSGESAFETDVFSGKTDLTLTGDITLPADAPPDYHLQAVLHEGRLTTPYMPHPFENTEGALSIDNNTMTLKDLKTRYQDTPLTLKGSWRQDAPSTLDLIVQSETTFEHLLQFMGKDSHPVLVEGPVHLTAKITGETQEPSVSGVVLLKDVTVTEAPLFQTVEHLHGEIHFTKDALESSRLSGEYEQRPFELTGKLSDFKDPKLDATLHFTKSLEVLKELPLFQNIPTEVRPTLKGTGVWDLKMRGPLGAFSYDQLTGSCALENASVTTPLLPHPAEKLDGKVSFDPKMIQLQSITGLYQEESFLLNGTFEPGESPKVSFLLQRPAVQLESRFTLNGKDLSPFSATHKTSEGTLSAQGDVLNYSDPTLRLVGRWEGSLRALQEIPGLSQALALPEGLEGHLKTSFTLSGPKRYPEALELSGEFQSKELRYKTWALHNASSRYRYLDETLTLMNTSGELFQGALVGDAAFQFRDNYYQFRIDLQKADLQKMMEALSQKESHFKGLLSGVLEADGSFTSASDFRGNGWFRVEKGVLFRVPILKGVIPTLVYPELDEMLHLHGAYAQLTIQNEKIAAENLILQGDHATLYGEGIVGFDQSLDLKLWMKFTNPALLERINEFSKLNPKKIFVDEMGMLSGEIHVTGTLEHPERKYNPLPLKRIRDMLRGTSEVLLERLFE